MTITLSTPATELTRYGSMAAKRLPDLGITTAADLLRYYPIRHDDLRSVQPIRSVQPGDTVTVRGRIELLNSRRSYRRRLVVVEALLKDESGTIPLIWFNQRFVAKILKIGDEVLVAGKVVANDFGIHLANPTTEKVQANQTHVGRLVPVYRVTHQLSQKQLRALTKSVLPLAEKLPDPLPDSLLKEYSLIPLRQALKDIHFPADTAALTAAKRRLAFEELLLFVLQLSTTHAFLKNVSAPAIPVNVPVVKTFVDQLPFTLTDDQRKAAWEILQALALPTPMNRLLEGDVGSGKTVVGAIALLAAVKAGFQVALMAPTEILASQHARALTLLLESQGVSVALLTRTQAQQDGVPVQKKTLLKRIATGEAAVVIGTHALLTETVQFAKLGLTVIDEQHRFGVSQRQHLRQEATADESTLPHLLSMTATPIPRSLALALYGDLDLSLLKQRPASRPPVTTTLLKAIERARAYDAISAAVGRGEQALIICPLVLESDTLGVKAATDEYERLRATVFSEYRVGLLHGKLPGKKKIATLEEFRAGAIQILVATSVVEVGIDNPNATVMIIEGAERFGLSQLHQLRGRIGRGTKASQCFLLPETSSSAARQRLEALASTTDGFALAELDLELRGPGHLAGVVQSGFFDFQLASLADAALVKDVRAAAKTLTHDDPSLQHYPALREALQQRDVHPE